MLEGTPTDRAGIGSPEAVTPREAPTRQRRSRRRRPGFWVAATALAVLGFAATVVLLNSTVYSSSGFVERYLAAIDRRDLASALDTPGVTVPAGADRGLLIRQATVPVEETHIVSDVDEGTSRAVTVAWVDRGERGQIVFHVEPAPPSFAVFTGWRFSESPLADVPLSIANAPAIRVNGVDLPAEPAQGAVSEVRAAALAPSRLTLDYESRYLRAEPEDVVAGGEATPATVQVMSTPRFVEEVQTELDDYLAQCATQKVLQPAQCPFGTFVEDRLVAPPTWSIVQSPVVTISPGVAPDTWLVPSTPGTARITAEVLSLFDGTRAPYSEDVPFTVAYTITIGPDGGLRIVGD